MGTKRNDKRGDKRGDTATGTVNEDDEDETGEDRYFTDLGKTFQTVKEEERKKPAFLNTVATALGNGVTKLVSLLQTQKDVFRGFLLALIFILGISLEGRYGVTIFLLAMVLFLISFPESILHLSLFLNNVVRDLLQKQPIKYLLHPRAVRKRLKEIHFLASMAIPVLAYLLLFPRAIWWYYLLLAIASFITLFIAMEVFFIHRLYREWQHPLQQITKKRLFYNWEFFFLIGILIASTFALFSLPQYFFLLIRGGLVFMLTVLFLFVVSIPVFSTEIRITHKIEEARKQQTYFKELEDTLEQTNQEKEKGKEEEPRGTTDNG